MKRIKWSKSDQLRAVSMGWMLSESGSKIVRCPWRVEFKTNREAQCWAVNAMVGNDWILGSRLNLKESEWLTCRKALLLCAGGGE